jgi:hypothetical protein
VGNGTQGLLIWGIDRLHLTIARTGFWDHRGGNPFSERIDYTRLLQMLQSGQEQQVRDLFRSTAQPGQPSRPQQLPGARLGVSFPRDLRPREATLRADGSLEIQVASAAGESHRLRLVQSIDSEVTFIDLPAELRGSVTVELVPAWRWVGEACASVGISPPAVRSLGASGSAMPGAIMTQRLPDDPALAVGWCDRGERLAIATALGSDKDADPAEPAIALLTKADPARVQEAAGQWWRDYWAAVPTLDLPDPDLMRLYTYGLYKFAGLTSPTGVPATLQGPWMEEYQLAPWSNDYHFNINLQMCYWPALSCNRLAHLAPLWAMIRGWFPTLATVGERFFGRDGAMMLPHATDDRCQAIGSFWQGTIDHASTAWMAHFAWLHYRHEPDAAFLRELVWPLLVGAFEGFWAMLEPVTATADGAPRLSLPLSVSPEFGEGAIGTWGRDASFQLAAVHRLALLLPRAAAALGEPVDPRWEQVRRELPHYSTAVVPLGVWDDPKAPTRHRIALWDGQDLTHSHRHHSHLAGIYPFATVDHADPAHRPVIEHSLRYWTAMGAGQWSAWSLPWVASICARADRADAAVAWLHWLIDNCENEGHNISVNGLVGAMGEWCGSDDARRKAHEPRPFEIMQLDANMGLITAVNDLLVHTADSDGAEEIRVLPRVPWRWKRLSFDGIRTEGGFLIGATVDGGQVQEVRVHSLAGQPLRLAHHLGPQWTLDGQPQRDAVLQTPTRPGQRLVLRRAAVT